MRPPRHDIAAPELPQAIDWVGERPRSMASLTAAGPVLVFVFDFAQLNSVRALPYVASWHRRYAELGLAVLGVQAPRFPFGADPQVVEAGLRRLDAGFPTAIDAAREIWSAYGCEGWPSLFLWGRGGVLRWFHFGEGEYAATEEAIQAELRELDALRDLPVPIPPRRPSDAPGALVMPPDPAEWLPGPANRPWVPEAGDETARIGYQAGGVHATVEGAGELRVSLDGRSLPAIAIAGASLYELVEHPKHEQHELLLGPGEGVTVWSVSFAPGVPP
jgi:hypothetical protein